MRAKFMAVAVMALFLSGCRLEVYDQLSQRDANEITALLLASGIDASRIEDKDGTFAVEVAEDEFALAVQLISESGLPRPQFGSMMDVFSDDNLIASPSEERARIAYAMSQELSRTITEIDGVTSARVHLSAPSLDPLGRKTTPSSASVALHHDAGMRTDGMVPRIKLLISHAVDDLDYDNVLVALFPVEQTSISRSFAGTLSRQDDTVIAAEMAWPSGFAPDRPAPGAPASDPSTLNPAIAAILAAGLIVLFIAARGLFDRPRRGGGRPEDVA